MNDIEFMNRERSEPLPAARPQHLKFCRDLMEQKDWEGMVKGMPEIWWHLFLAIKEGKDHFNGAPILRSDVNKFVDNLKKCPSKKKAEKYERQRSHQNRVSEDGIYVVHIPNSPDKVFKVYWNLEETRLLAKELIIVKPAMRDADGNIIRQAISEWEYRGQAFRFVSDSDRYEPTLEEALEFGPMYGRCGICGRTLNAELSMALGIGPVCGGRKFGGEFKFMLNEAKLRLNLSDSMHDLDEGGE